MIVCLVVYFCGIMLALVDDHFKLSFLSDSSEKLKAKDNAACMLLTSELLHLLNQTREALKESMLLHKHPLDLGIADAKKAGIRSTTLPRMENTLPALDGSISTKVGGAVTRISPAPGGGFHTSGRLASEASYGFLEYSDSQWGKMVAVHRAQSRRQYGRATTDGKTYFQYNWEPTLSCALEQRIGSMGDGGKWVCDAYKIAEAEECNVVSIGSNNDWSFEEAVHQLNPRCKIFTFDHTSAGVGRPPYVTFHKIGIGDRDSGPFLTVGSALRKVGLENKMIDLFKIDCEGCEKRIFPGLLKPFLRQILIEVHSANWGVNGFFEAMTEAGYVIFHKEPNTWGSGGECAEYSFLKMDPGFAAEQNQ